MVDIKQATAVSIPLSVALPTDQLWFVLIPAALVAAWLARAAKMLRANRSWPEIRKDFVVSLLLGASVGLFALLLISYFALSYIWGMAVAWALAFGGVPAINLIYAKAVWVFGKVVEDAVGDDAD